MLVNAERLIGRFEQQPRERKRYRVDFRQHLADGETVLIPTFEVTPVTVPPLQITDVALGPDADQLLMFVEGGLDGITYQVTMLTVTSDTQELEDELEFRIREF
jgi:hypothetical protein